MQATFPGDTRTFQSLSSPKMTKNYRSTGPCATTCNINIVKAAFALVKVTDRRLDSSGMAIYEASFVFLSTICLLLYLFTGNSSQQSAAGGDGSFRKFQRKYLTVYIMAQGRVCLFQWITVRPFHGKGFCGGQSEAIILYAKLKLDLSNQFIVLIDHVNSTRWCLSCCEIIFSVELVNNRSFWSLTWTVLRTYNRISLVSRAIYQLF